MRTTRILTTTMILATIGMATFITYYHEKNPVDKKINEWNSEYEQQNTPITNEPKVTLEETALEAEATYWNHAQFVGETSGEVIIKEGNQAVDKMFKIYKFKNPVGEEARLVSSPQGVYGDEIYRIEFNKIQEGNTLTMQDIAVKVFEEYPDYSLEQGTVNNVDGILNKIERVDR